jgi:hypothetical protein
MAPGWWKVRIKNAVAAKDDDVTIDALCAELSRLSSPVVVTPPASVENLIGQRPQPIPPSDYEPMADTEPEI